MPPIGTASKSLRLVVVEGVDAGASVEVTEQLTVGKSDRSDFVLTDPTVSRRHLTAEPSAIGLRIRDRGSRNGTWSGDERLYDAEVPEGGELRLGNTRLRVESSEATEKKASDEAKRTSFGRFVGSAPVLAPLYRKLEKAAPSSATILLEGESGTGKELLAEAIHDESPRRDGPFVVVDCGAVAETLVESELFGHEKGAFTGAERVRVGAFEQAHGGTIFLDEVGELPLGLQTRLLRVLDRRHLRRLGGDRRIEVDVRVVAATNRDLEREVEESRFRLDLFHRLAVVLLRVPPLRERKEDLPELARQLVTRLGGDESSIGEEAIARLSHHDWPGNVRELRNHVERLVLLGDAATTLGAARPADADPFAAAARSGQPYRKARAEVLDAFASAYVEDMLGRHDGNVSAAAKAAGIARRHFQRLKAK
jgi:DNA-binding NtrC family response regulator